jgi:peptidoglycan lytic transglycosylase
MRGLVLLALSLGVAGCAGPPRTATPEPAPVREAPPARVSTVGKASWYGAFHHGRRTASGEIFDMHALTAAHRTLPLGTRLRVTNLSNGKSIDVRVNDRGPTIRSRIIDVSRGVATALDAVAAGVFPVELVILLDGGPRNGPPYPPTFGAARQSRAAPLYPFRPSLALGAYLGEDF